MPRALRARNRLPARLRFRRGRSHRPRRWTARRSVGRRPTGSKTRRNAPDALRRRHRAEVVEQRLRRLDRRQPIATALLAGAHRDGTPMRLFRRRLRLVETHHAALAQDGHDARDPEFRRFLHDEVHAIAARHALQQRHLEGRFPVDERAAPIDAETREPRTLSMAPSNSRPSPLNSTSFIAVAGAQHLRQMRSRVPRQLHDTPRTQIAVDKHASQSHSVRSRSRVAFICAQLSHMLATASEPKGMHLQVDLDSGLMRGARQVASPNCDARPPGVEADLIVVHGISLPPGEFGGPWIERLFMNTLPLDMHPYFAEDRRAARVLASAGGARRRADAVRQIHRSSLACGAVRYDGRQACNDFSIGVELEGVDTAAL